MSHNIGVSLGIWARGGLPLSWCVLDICVCVLWPWAMSLLIYRAFSIFSIFERTYKLLQKYIYI